MSCIEIMGQSLAKKDLEEGLRLYSQQQSEAAVRTWEHALSRLKKRHSRFVTLGYLAMAHGDTGKYRDMLTCSVQQMDIANEANDAEMRCEAYLNLARSNEKLCEYHKAISYCRHALHNQPKDPRVSGYVHLCQGNSYTGFSNYTKALESFEQAMKVAKKYDEKALELQVYSSLGNLFTQLKDFQKGLAFQLRAAELAKSFKICDVTSKFHRVACYNIAVPYKELGRNEQASLYCEDALKMAVAESDKPTQAKCLACFADIHRGKNDCKKAMPRYEAGLRMLMQCGDRSAQVEVLLGMSRTMVLMQQLGESPPVCECKALEVDAKALDLACSIGSKMLQLRCHEHMASLYRSLADYDMVEEQDRNCRRLLSDMELICAICCEPMSDKPDKLDALPCFHLVHSKCASSLSSCSLPARSRLGNCPRCRNSLHRSHPDISPTLTSL